jgi:hypothetical protein
VDVLREPVARAVRGYIYLIYPHLVPTFGAVLCYGVRLRKRRCGVRFPVMAFPCNPSTMTVERDRGNRIIMIGQQQYVLDMLERFNIMDCKQVGSPMAVDAYSNCVETSTPKLPPGLVPYQSVIGSLLHASVSTRPESPWLLATIVGMYMSDPSQSHWKQAKRVLR